MSPATPKSRAKRGRGSTSPGPPQAQNPDTSDVVQGRLTKSEWVAMVMLEEGEEAVAWILDELMGHVKERCYRVYLQRQLIPFTVSKARDALVQVMEWQFLMQDRGEGLDSAPLWVEDSEPQPCVTDSWAQGCVPLYSKSPPPPTILPQAGPNKPMSLQRISGPAVSRVVTPKPKQKAQSVRQAAAVHDDPARDQRDRAKHPGVTSVEPKVPSPAPRKQREERGKQPSPRPALRTPHLHLLRRVLGCAASQEEQGPTTPILRATPQPRRPDVPEAQRLKPNRQPRRYVCPGFEVLKSSSAPLPSGRKEARKLKALTLFEGFSEGQQRGAPAGPDCVFSTRNIQGGGQAQGFTPLSVSLLLGTMKLSPGVSIRDPPGAPTDSKPERRADLKPVRNALPTPLLMPDQLMLEPAPRVTPPHFTCQ